MSENTKIEYMIASDIDSTGQHFIGGAMLAITRYYPHYCARESVVMGRADMGYCIDAPNSLPAGACAWLEVDEDEGLPVQLEIHRECTQ